MPAGDRAGPGHHQGRAPVPARLADRDPGGAGLHVPDVGAAEIQAAMAFRAAYRVIGTRREQVASSATPSPQPAAEWLIDHRPRRGAGHEGRLPRRCAMARAPPLSPAHHDEQTRPGAQQTRGGERRPQFTYRRSPRLPRYRASTPEPHLEAVSPPVSGGALRVTTRFRRFVPGWRARCRRLPASAAPLAGKPWVPPQPLS